MRRFLIILFLLFPPVVLADGPADLQPAEDQPAEELSLYLPIVFQDYCFFEYEETIYYNLSIIEAPPSWCWQRGGGVVVAVVDSGVDLDHPDLAGNLVTGASFVDYTTSPDDDNGHGTHIAGIVAGIVNDFGIIGVAPEASIMPIKSLESDGGGYSSQVAEGIRWAVDHGATVINLSLTGPSGYYTLQSAVDYAYEQGALVVAAGGNCGDPSNLGSTCSYTDQAQYPAAFSAAIAVAATDQLDYQADFSNTSDYIEVAAPGEYIYSTYHYNRYYIISGTSQATAHVSGLAALLWSQNPTWSNEQVRQQIRNTADDLGDPGLDAKFGYGRINSRLALQQPLTLAATEETGLAAAEPPGRGVEGVEIDDTPFAPGEVLVKLKPGFTLEQVIDQAGLHQQSTVTIPGLQIHRLAVPVGQEKTTVTRLLSQPGVAYAELNYRVTGA